MVNCVTNKGSRSNGASALVQLVKVVSKEEGQGLLLGYTGVVTSKSPLLNVLY